MRPSSLTTIKSISFSRQYKEYRRASAWGTRSDAFYRMRAFNSLAAQLICTETAIELASDSYKDSDRERFLSLSLESAEISRDLIRYKPPYDQQKLAGIRLLPNIPALVNLKVLQERPNLRQLQSAFDLHRQELTATYAVARDKVPADQKPMMEGVVAESFVLLSLQRYALKNHGDMSWIPLPAIGHENSTYARGSILQPTWDISVYTALLEEDDPVLSYKAQVKRSQSGLREKAYAEDISLVYVSNNLASSREKGYDDSPFVNIGRIMADVSPEADRRHLQSWDERTEKILDILG